MRNLIKDMFRRWWRRSGPIRDKAKKVAAVLGLTYIAGLFGYLIGRGPDSK